MNQNGEVSEQDIRLLAPEQAGAVRASCADLPGDLSQAQGVSPLIVVGAIMVGVGAVNAAREGQRWLSVGSAKKE
jgi:hypothetical protein